MQHSEGHTSSTQIIFAAIIIIMIIKILIHRYLLKWEDITFHRHAVSNPFKLKDFNSNIKLWVAALRLCASFKQYLWSFCGTLERTNLLDSKKTGNERNQEGQVKVMNTKPQLEREGNFKLKVHQRPKYQGLPKTQRESKPKHLLCETPNTTTDPNAHYKIICWS